MNRNLLHVVDSGTLAGWVRDARQRTLELVADLSDEHLIGPPLPTLNPMLWELGHIAWFQERWTRRRDGRPSIRAKADALYDSAGVPHETRWDLQLLPRMQVLEYLRDVEDLVLRHLDHPGFSPEDAYFVLLAVFHEDMHTEAFTYTRQTLGYPAPRFNKAGYPHSDESSPNLMGDVEIPGGAFMLGATGDEPFIFDNEKWAHPVRLAPFAIARTPVTQAEFAAFVEDGGYRRREWWSEPGWSWRAEANAEHPVYWRRDGNHSWSRRQFDQWVPLEPRLPVIHVNWYEAEAYCCWAKRRLPTEAEREAVAAAEPGPGGLSARKRRFPWGDNPPTADEANLDWQAMGCLDVSALPAGDSAFGCRQLIGNVWEWTSSDFLPYPGFVIDPYKEYSVPWFGTHKVLRGGCWATRGRLLRNTWRNFYTPERRDIFAGFRTCALR